MKPPASYLFLCCTLALCAGCGGMSAREADLARARGAYAAAQEKSWVSDYASVELYDARLALERAEKAEEAQDRQHLAYLAERKAQIAVAAAERRLSDAEIADLAREKNRLQLQVREARIDHERTRARALEAELAALHARKTDRGMILTLGEALFAFDRTELLPDARPVFDRLAAFLKKHADRSVLIEGHTDSIGSQSYNLELSQRRAEAARDALLERGVPFYRIVAKGCGEAWPVAGNDTEAGRRRNRRIEIIILDPGVKAGTMLR